LMCDKLVLMGPRGRRWWYSSQQHMKPSLLV